MVKTQAPDDMPSYPVKLESAFSGGFFVKCDTFEGVIGHGDSARQALGNAAEYLGLQVLMCEFEKKSPPRPLAAKPDEIMVAAKFPT